MRFTRSCDCGAGIAVVELVVDGDQLLVGLWSDSSSFELLRYLEVLVADCTPRWPRIPVGASCCSSPIANSRAWPRSRLRRHLVGIAPSLRSWPACDVCSPPRRASAGPAAAVAAASATRADRVVERNRLDRHIGQLPSLARTRRPFHDAVPRAGSQRAARGKREAFASNLMRFMLARPARGEKGLVAARTADLHLRVHHERRRTDSEQTWSTCAARGVKAEGSASRVAVGRQRVARTRAEAVASRDLPIW